MNVAIYLSPQKATSLDGDEDYLLTSPELSAYLKNMQPVTKAVLVPVSELRPLIDTVEGEVADHLRETLSHLDDGQMVMLAKRPLVS